MDRLDRLLELIEVEHQAELEKNQLELDRLPAQVRETLGKTVTRLTAEEGPSAEGAGSLLCLSRAEAGEELSPFHAMSRGDLVCAEAPTGQRFNATLYEVDEYRVEASPQNRIPDPLPRGRWSLHLIGSDATFRRMKAALGEVRSSGRGPLGRLRDVSFGRTPARSERVRGLAFFDTSLNEWQRKAVESALGAQDFALVHGPPGTGKTTVLVEVVRQAAARGERVLASAPSNIAVDNMVEKLLGAGLRIVRLGHPARTLESLRHATMAAQAAAHPDARLAHELDQRREQLLHRRERESGGGRRALQGEIQALWREARDLRRSAEQRLLREAQVVLATHGSLGKPLSAKPFDLAVLDEASQATEPLSWIPLLQAHRAVLAGDPMQLPPTLYSMEAAKEGLSLTFFERLQGILPEGLKTLLRVQYRMHEEIMAFPSAELYEGRLIADETVRRHLLSAVPGVARTPLTETPLVFVDTSGAGFEEGWDEILQSRENVEEAGLAARILKELLAAGLAPARAACITPYVAQVRRLKALLKGTSVEVGTVDGFQGREKEAVVLSLVRSNPKGEVGFLEDARRLNVALTRARRLLVVVGDGATLASNPLLSRFVDSAQNRGFARSAWEWLGTEG